MSTGLKHDMSIARARARAQGSSMTRAWQRLADQPSAPHPPPTT
jgi:hypothetical protein